MDNKTMIVLLSVVAMVGTGVWFATRASVENTKLKTEATVAKAQEHTKRAEGRHQLMDLLGIVKGR